MISILYSEMIKCSNCIFIKFFYMFDFGSWRSKIQKVRAVSINVVAYEKGGSTFPIFLIFYDTSEQISLSRSLDRHRTEHRILNS